MEFKKVRLSTIMFFILALEVTKITLVIAKKDAKNPNSSEPKLTVEEACVRSTNKSSCTSHFGPIVAQKKKDKRATISFYLKEGAKLARVELEKAKKVGQSLGSEVNKGCEHNIDLALDCMGANDNKGGSATGNTSSNSGESYVDWRLSDALSETSTCLDNVEMLVPEKLVAMQNALEPARELIRNMIDISVAITGPAF